MSSASALLIGLVGLLAVGPTFSCSSDDSNNATPAQVDAAVDDGGANVPDASSDTAAPPPPANLVTDAQSVAPTTTVQTSTVERYTATIDIPGIAATPIVEGGQTYQRLSIFGGGHFAALGKPEVPYITKVIVLPRLPNGAVVNPVVTVTPSKLTRATALDVHPAQPAPVDHPVADVLAWPAPQFTRVDAAYASTDSYPNVGYESEVRRIGGLDVLVVRLYPVQVNAGGHTADVWQKLDLDVDMNPTHEAVSAATLVDETDVDGTVTFKHDETPGWLANGAVVKIAPRIFPPLLDQGTVDDPNAQMIIVAPSALAQLVNQLALHKKQKMGMRVKLVTTDIVGGSALTAGALRLYLHGEWDNNGMLAEFSDPSEASIAAANNIKQVQVYRHRTAQGLNDQLGIDVLYGATPGDEVVTIGFSQKNATGGYDGKYILTMDKPSLNQTLAFAVKESTGASPKTVATGTAKHIKNGWRFEFAAAPVLPGPSDETWIRVWQGSSIIDVAPDTDPMHVGGAITERFMKYVLLFGDVDTIATNYDVSEFEGGPPEAGKPKLRVATDYYYGTLEGSLGKDFTPTLHVGRIPVKTATDAITMIQKIVDYETDNPYARMRPRVAVSGLFQDDDKDGHADRPFIDTTERVRSYFTARGNDVARAYVADPAETPLKFNDGRDLPDELKKPTFAWNASTNDLKTILNDYKNYLVLHRDHAGIEGWGAPSFLYTDVDALDAPPTSPKGMLPVIISANCASGYFDQETDYREDVNGATTPNTDSWSATDARNFAEAMLRKNGGAVGVIAASRLSSSWHNDVLVDGMLGALFPDYPTYNASAPTDGAQALGNMLDWAKFYHAVMYAKDDSGIDKMYFELFNVLGDPSLRVQRLPR